MIRSEDIIKELPYRAPFLFVDKVYDFNSKGLKGTYTLKEDEYFYKGHFPTHPITPGVIVTEIMAQIGLVCFGIYLLKNQKALTSPVLPIFSSANVEFMAPAFPGDTLEVVSEIVYFRFNKLKCKIRCYNRNTEKEISRGEFSGMLIKENEFEK